MKINDYAGEYYPQPEIKKVLKSDSNWITIHFKDGYRARAKLFATASIFGIDGCGRISIFTLKKDKKNIYHYDRGLEICEKITPVVKKHLEVIKKAFTVNKHANEREAHYNEF